MLVQIKVTLEVLDLFFGTDMLYKLIADLDEEYSSDGDYVEQLLTSALAQHLSSHFGQHLNLGTSHLDMCQNFHSRCKDDDAVLLLNVYRVID